MLNPMAVYLRILHTYWERARSSWTSLLFVLSTFVWVLVSIVNPRNAPNYLPFIFMTVMFLGGPMWLHLREQLASDRRQIWPGYAKPHVVVFGVLAGLMVVGWPTAILFLGGPRSWGMMAVIASWFALVGWCVVTLWPPLMWAAAAISLAAVFGYVSGPLASFIRGRYESLALVMLAAAMAAIGGALAWLLRLTEENPAYHRSAQLSGWSLRARMTGEGDRAWAQPQTGWLSRWMQPRGICVVDRSAGLWNRARRWRSLCPANLKVAAVSGVALVAGSLIPQWPNRANSGMSAQIVMPLIWASFMPAMSVSQLWLRQWRYIENESLRPIERSEFLKELGLTLAIQLFQTWSVLVLLAIGAQVVLWPGVTTASFASTVVFLVESLLEQVFLFGVVVWFLRFRSPVKAVLPFILATMPVSVLISAANAPAWDDQPQSELALIRKLVLPSIIALAGAGLLIARNAYQKWLNTELG